MNWFKGSKSLNKTLSLLGCFVLMVLLVLSMTLPKKQKKFLSKKQSTRSRDISKDAFKLSDGWSDIYKEDAAPLLVKSPAKKDLIKPHKVNVQKVARHHFVKKNFKRKQSKKMVARAKSGANDVLSRDSWHYQHEQIETIIKKVGEDPVGAAAFEDRRVTEELAAAGI